MVEMESGIPVVVHVKCIDAVIYGWTPVCTIDTNSSKFIKIENPDIDNSGKAVENAAVMANRHARQHNKRMNPISSNNFTEDFKRTSNSLNYRLGISSERSLWVLKEKLKVASG